MAQGMYACRHVADAHRSADAVELRLAEGMILELAEIRQHVPERPARITGGGPVVEVCGLSAHVHHGVDRGRTPEHLAAGPELTAVIERRVGLRLVHPVE